MKQPGVIVHAFRGLQEQREILRSELAFGVFAVIAVRGAMLRKIKARGLGRASRPR